KPEHIAEQACGDRKARQYDEVRLSVSSDSSGGEQNRNRRDRQTSLLSEDSQKHHQLDMMEQKFESLMHGVLRLHRCTTVLVTPLSNPGLPTSASRGWRPPRHAGHQPHPADGH